MYCKLHVLVHKRTELAAPRWSCSRSCAAFVLDRADVTTRWAMASLFRTELSISRTGKCAHAVHQSAIGENRDAGRRNNCMYALRGQAVVVRIPRRGLSVLPAIVSSLRAGLDWRHTLLIATRKSSGDFLCDSAVKLPECCLLRSACSIGVFSRKAHDFFLPLKKTRTISSSRVQPQMHTRSHASRT